MDKGKGRALQAAQDGGIALTVTPASSAFFSGEPLVFEIKFTNTRTPRPSSSTGPSSSTSLYPPVTRGHARAASSILASSAPASRSTFPSSTLATPTASPARSYLDLSTINASGTSSHIILPERRGVVGSSLAISGTNSRSTSPFYTKRLGSSQALSPSQTIQEQQAASLYAEKRLPTVRHKKNDYSIAIHNGAYDMAQEDEADDGVSDLSSQLAGQAILHERESSGEAELGVIDARPFVEQYKRQGDALTGRVPSYSKRHPSSFSTISEEEGPTQSPPKRFSPSRSLSYSSYASSAASTARIPSSSSAFEALDQEYTPRTSAEFYGLSRNDSVDSVLRDSITSYAGSGRQQRQPLPHLRPPKPHGRSYSATSTPPHSAPIRPASQHGVEEESGTETLLWSFAQFTGSFTVENALVKNGEFLSMKQDLFGARAGGAGRSDSFMTSAHIGGGTLEAQQAPDPAQGTVSGKLASWIWGSGKSTPQIERRRSSAALATVDPVLDASHRRASTAGVHSTVTSTTPTLGSLEERRNKAMSDDSFPVFSSPPSVLAVDLVLEPGESKTYTFTLRLPGDLPPSFRGKAISFNYSFMVGTNRAPNRAAGESSQQSRLVRVPVRIYNNVSVTGVRPFYDLTNPIVWHRDEAKITSDNDLPDDLLDYGQKRTRQRSGSIETAFAAARKQEQKAEFYEYATKLLEACALAADEEQKGSSSRSSPVPEMDKMSSFPDGGPAARPELMQRSSSQMLAAGALGQEGEDTSCKSAVEIVSRNAQKVSYDINKDGYRIATLTLVKSAYRLGDTVNAMISLNGGAARVLRLAARLETHELIETTVSIKNATQVRSLTRRLHAEHHETTLDSGRVSFAMAIPSGATPDFATSAVKLHWSLRVSFLILPPQQSHTQSTSAEGAYRSQGKQSRSASPSISAHPLSASHGKSKSLAFNPSSPSTPIPVETGSHHLLPVPPVSPEQQYTSYRAVPDLAFLPTLFQSPEAHALSQQHGQIASPSIGSSGKLDEAVVLMPTKIETVEIAIPIRVYPSATPFRSPMSTFRV